MCLPAALCTRGGGCRALTQAASGVSRGGNLCLSRSCQCTKAELEPGNHTLPLSCYFFLLWRLQHLLIMLFILAKNNNRKECVIPFLPSFSSSTKKRGKKKKKKTLSSQQSKGFVHPGAFHAESFPLPACSEGMHIASSLGIFDNMSPVLCNFMHPCNLSLLQFWLV